MTEDRRARPRGSPRKPDLSVFATNLLIFIWWPVPAASFLFVSAIFFGVALVLEILVVTSPLEAALLPQVTGATVVLGLLTAYGVRAYRVEKEKAFGAEAPRRIK